MMDLKVMNAVLQELEETRGISKDTLLEAIKSALATAYKKEYGKRDQIIRAEFDLNSGKTEFYQVKEVVKPEDVVMPEDEMPEDFDPENPKIRFNAERHMLIEDAKRIKRDVEAGGEIVFPLEHRDDFGRIAAQTAKQVIIQKLREAEKQSVLGEFGEREGDVISGIVQRVERGTVYVDLGRATGVIPYEEQIPGERFKPGERVRAFLYAVDDASRGVFLRLSRSHPKFLLALFKLEAPEVESGAVEIKAIAREAGSRSKLAVHSNDGHIDPIGALVGQRGVRVGTVMSELRGEKIDIISWSEDAAQFIADALSPAEVLKVNLDEKEHKAVVDVTPDEQSLAIGRGGQNVRLAAKLTGWKIDIKSTDGAVLAQGTEEGVKVNETPTAE